MSTANPASHYSGGIDSRSGTPPALRAAHQQPEKNDGAAAPAKRAAWRGSQTLVEAGQRIAVTVINRMDLSYMATFINDIHSEDDRVRDDALSVLVGISATLAAVFEGARDSGKVNFTGERLATPVEVQYAARTNMARFTALLKSQIDILEKIFASEAGLVVSLPGAAAQKADTPVNLEPVAVRVVEMPARHTVTSLDRDSAGEITGSEQIEKDL